MSNKNKQWTAMAKILCESDSRCLWQQDVRNVAMVECWMIGGMPVIFTAYHHGGFDVFTLQLAPREIDEIMPWILEQS